VFYVNIKLSHYLFYKGEKLALSQSWRKHRWGAQQNKADRECLELIGRKQGGFWKITHWVRQAVCMREMRNWHKLLVGKSQGKRPFAEPRYSCKDKIMINFTATGQNGQHQSEVVQDKVKWWALSFL
jgi:hypothetical protein